MNVPGSEPHRANYHQHHPPPSHVTPVSSAPQSPQMPQAPHQFHPTPSPLSQSHNVAPPPPPQPMQAPHGAPVQHGSPHLNGHKDRTPEAIQADALRGSHQYRALADAMRQAPPQVAQQVIRDHWTKCFVGSEQHLAFVLSGVIRQADPNTLRQCILESGTKMAPIANHLLGFFNTEGLENVADLILGKASHNFLDKALAKRLESIDARSLVNALAKAERLGYDTNDVVQERVNGGPESVVPAASNFEAPLSLLQGAGSQNGLPQQYSLPSQPPKHAAPPPPQQSGPSGSSSGAADVCVCTNCDRPCSSESALLYHLKRNACEEYQQRSQMYPVAKRTCAHCGCPFTTDNGLNYHVRYKVCGRFEPSMTTTITMLLHEFSQGTGAAMGSLLKRGVQTQSSPAPASQPPPPPPPQQQQQQQQQVTVPATEDEAQVHMEPHVWKEYQQQQRDTEAKYGKMMREAMKLPELQKVDQFARLRNRYNTKQSTTRKRYGIRLRERRTREDIDSERIRVLGPNGPAIWTEMDSLIRKYQSAGHNIGSGPEPMWSTPTSTPSKSVATPQTNSPNPGGLIRSDLVGGLSASAGSAATTDPTAGVQTQANPRVLAQVHQQQHQTQGLQPDPDAMAVDSDDDDDDDDISTDDDSSDDDDIPHH